MHELRHERNHHHIALPADVRDVSELQPALARIKDQPTELVKNMRDALSSASLDCSTLLLALLSRHHSMQSFLQPCGTCPTQHVPVPTAVPQGAITPKITDDISQPHPSSQVCLMAAHGTGPPSCCEKSWMIWLVHTICLMLTLCLCKLGHPYGQLLSARG